MSNIKSPPFTYLMLSPPHTRLRVLLLNVTLYKLLLLLFLLLPNTVYAAWPVSWELGGEKRFLGPLISYDEENQERHVVLRPFLFSYDSEEGGIYNYLFRSVRSPGKNRTSYPFICPKGPKLKAIRHFFFSSAAHPRREATEDFSLFMENFTTGSQRMKWISSHGPSTVTPRLKAR